LAAEDSFPETSFMVPSGGFSLKLPYLGISSEKLELPGHQTSGLFGDLAPDFSGSVFLK